MGSHAGTFFFDMRPTTTGERGIVIAGDSCATTSGLTIAWDGRLDNRDDLLLQLGGAVTSAATDQAFACTVFRRWGIEGLRRLAGEWSLALWDRERRTLHLARDYAGARPLYYCAGERSVMWSSDLGELADRSGRSNVLSAVFPAAFMTLRYSSEITPYEGVHAVPGAACITFTTETGKAAKVFTYWTPDGSSIRYRDARQYEEHLQSLWSSAVRARLRGDEIVWAHLSGGLDSSAVVCMADSLIKGGAADASQLRTVSHVTLESPEGDERRFIAEVEARTGVRSDILGVEKHHDLEDESLMWITPFCARGVSLATARHVLERGGRTLLSGHFGDNVMGCDADNSVAVWDDIADGRWRHAIAKLRRWSRSTRKPIWEIAHRVASAGLSDTVAEPIDLAFDGRSMLTPALQRLVPRCARLDLRSISPSKRDLAASVVLHARESQLDIPIQPRGIALAYPFLDRRLVEFALAIPGEQLSAPGETRALMRRAFDGLVPARILRRISKGYYPPSLTRAARVRAASMRPVDRLEVVQRGWVNGAALDRAIGMLVDGGSAGREVRRVLRLEEWLRARHRRGPATIPRRKEVTTDEVLNA
ncbi:MAG TPA: asparagine synthase-related protein [Vicinamibacterales bacterium]|jgi:asparagine synthase (glutamine-hydrolysing)